MLDLPINNIGTLPGLELQIIQDKILLFLFCSIRISAFLISSPIFGAGLCFTTSKNSFCNGVNIKYFSRSKCLN